MQEDYYSALASIVMAAAKDNAQLRSVIYELARGKLRQQLDRQAKALSSSERAQQLLVLESAIQQIEADLARSGDHETRSRPDILSPANYASVEIIPPARHLPPLSEPLSEFRSSPKRSASYFNRSALMLVATALLVAVTYVELQRGVYWETRFNALAHQGAAIDATRSPNRPLVPIIPTPTAYGVYALINGQLTELQPLPVRLPDPRVPISGTISAPSTTKLPNGRAQFIVYRRDLVSQAPEKVMVRVVAQVRGSDLTDQAIAPTGGNVLWALRGISYEMNVVPVAGNPAMILIHPRDADFLFPAGRYALVLNKVAYDFSIDGPITDLAQCVERDDQATAPEYAECRTSR